MPQAPSTLSPEGVPSIFGPMRLRWVAVGILVVTLAAVAAVLVFANRLIDANRDRILSAAENAIGRPVHIGSIGARLIGRPGVRLTDVSIADDPAFGADPFISARSAAVLVKLWPLLRGRLEIARIELEQPLVRIVRAADGRFNYSTLGPVDVAPAARPASTAPPAPAPSAGAGLAWAVALFDIDDGAVDFIDRTVSPPHTVAARRIALRASDIALDEAIHFDLHASVDSASDNVDLSGEVGPLVSREGVPFTLGGAIGPFEQEPLRLQSLEVRGRARTDGIDLEQIGFKAFGGELAGQGTIPLTEHGPFSFNGKGTGLRLSQLLPVVAPKARQEIEGKAAIEADLQGVGSTAEALRASLRGEVTASVRDGVLRRYNLPGEVVKRISDLPGLTQLISRGVKPKYAAVLNRPDTKFETLDLRLRLVPGAVQVEGFKLVGEDFGADAEGRVGDGGNADLRGTVQLSKRFSADVAADVREARLLFNQDDEISVPFRYRGVVGQAKPEADLERMATSVFGTRGGQLVDEVQRSLKGLFR